MLLIFLQVLVSFKHFTATELCWIVGEVIRIVQMSSDSGFGLDTLCNFDGHYLACALTFVRSVKHNHHD